MKKEENKEKNIKKNSGTKKGNTTKKTTNKKVEKKVASKKDVTKEVKKEKIEEVIIKDNVIEEVVEDIEDMEEELVVEEALEKKKRKINKSDIVLVVGLILVIALGCFMMWGEKPVPAYELPLTLSGEAGLHQLTYAELKEKIDNKDEFVLILERATCSHCITYMPIAEKFANENSVPMYYVDTDTFNGEDWQEFEQVISYLKESKGNWGTPTTLVQAGGETVEFVEGSTGEETLLNLYNAFFDMSEK